MATTGKSRGRPAGAVSFCKVSLAELNRLLKPEANVMVSVRFAAMIGASGQLLASDLPTVTALGNNPSVSVEIQDFSGDKALQPVIEVTDF